jgi:hypothetical protein
VILEQQSISAVKTGWVGGWINQAIYGETDEKKIALRVF